MAAILKQLHRFVVVFGRVLPNIKFVYIPCLRCLAKVAQKEVKKNLQTTCPVKKQFKQFCLSAPMCKCAQCFQTALVAKMATSVQKPFYVLPFSKSKSVVLSADVIFKMTITFAGSVISLKMPAVFVMERRKSKKKLIISEKTDVRVRELFICSPKK